MERKICGAGCSSGGQESAAPPLPAADTFRARPDESRPSDSPVRCKECRPWRIQHLTSHRGAETASPEDGTWRMEGSQRTSPISRIPNISAALCLCGSTILFQRGFHQERMAGKKRRRIDRSQSYPLEPPAEISGFQPYAHFTIQYPGRWLGHGCAPAVDWPDVPAGGGCGFPVSRHRHPKVFQGPPRRLRLFLCLSWIFSAEPDAFSRRTPSLVRTIPPDATGCGLHGGRTFPPGPGWRHGRPQTDSWISRRGVRGRWCCGPHWPRTTCGT